MFGPNFNTRNTRHHKAVVARFVELIGGDGHDVDRLALTMDIAAADGVNGYRPIDWPRMLGSRTLLAHDVAGIARHMDRGTGRLRDGFIPRCATS